MGKEHPLLHFSGDLPLTFLYSAIGSGIELGGLVAARKSFPLTAFTSESVNMKYAELVATVLDENRQVDSPIKRITKSHLSDARKYCKDE